MKYENIMIITGVVVIILIIVYFLFIREKYEDDRYNLIIPPNHVLISRVNMQYGSSAPNYTIDQAIEIYKRGLKVVEEWNKSEYKKWETAELGDKFTNIVTAILFKPDKARDITKDMDDFNNNRVIAAVNIASLEAMPQPPEWVTNREFMDAFNKYSNTHDELWTV